MLSFLFVLAEGILNGKVGDKVVLQPNTPVTGTIKSIVWKHNNNLAMQSDGQSIDGYRQFECKLSRSVLWCLSTLFCLCAVKLTSSMLVFV